MPIDFPRHFAALALFASAVLTSACVDQAARATAYGITGGDPQRGIAAVSKYGCGSCHTIAGNRSAHGLVGPPLTGIGNRMYVAGVLENTPDNIVRWIQHPKAVDDKTVMPDLGVTQQDATDIAAYLYSTR
jgi:cytochrome c